MTTTRTWNPPGQAAPKSDGPPKAIKIKAQLHWAQLKERNDMSGKYQVDLCQLSQLAVEALGRLGVEARSRDDQPEKGMFITPKSDRTISAYDVSGNEIFDPIGNGSEAEAIITSYDWNFQGKSGISPSLQRLTVTKLEDYAGDYEVENEVAF